MMSHSRPMRALLLGCALLSAGSLAACRHSNSGGAAENGVAKAEGPPVRGDWVIVRSLSDPKTLNPVTTTDAGAQEIETYLYETLTTTDPQTLKTIPVLADSLAEVSDDHLHYDFHIRPEATFSDGSHVTAADFIFYLKALKNPYIVDALPLAGYYSRVKSAEMVGNDSLHLRVVMSEPYFLGDQFAGGLSAIPKHILDPDGITDHYSFSDLNSASSSNPAVKQFADLMQKAEYGNQNPYLVGTGPYKFFEWKRNEQVVLVRNESYWNPDFKWGKAYPDRLVWRTINDGNAAVAALKSGSIDFLPNVEPFLFNREKSQFPTYHVVPAVYDYPGYVYIGYNEDRPMFADKLVRQALSHAVNRDGIIKSVYFGLAHKIESPIGTWRPECDTTLAETSFDPALAKKLLAEAGWSDSNGDGVLDKMINGVRTDFSFTVVTNSGNDRRKYMGEIFVEELKKLGIRASLQQLDWALLLNRTRDGDYDAFIGGWGASAVEGDMYQLWDSKSAERGGSNYVRFRNERVDQLINQIRGEFDFQKRIPMYKEIQQIIYEEKPYTFLLTERYPCGYNDRFQNVTFYPPRPCYLPNLWWVPKDRQKYTGGAKGAATQ